jgi:NAD(P)-dependent dehydrogenase (short-subunit alcohol dehydrogenase family)
MSKIIVITGASSGFGALTARALADAGHTVYAGMRDIAGRNAKAAADALAANLNPVEMIGLWAYSYGLSSGADCVTTG